LPFVSLVRCVYICRRRNACVPCSLPPPDNHHNIRSSNLLPLLTTPTPALTLRRFSSNSPQDNNPTANTLTGISLSVATTWSPAQGLRTTMTQAFPIASAVGTMSPLAHTRASGISNASRPQRPGPARPPQPRDGDTRHVFSSMNASFASRQDPQPRDPGNGRRSRGPQPRDPGGKRDPQPRDPGT
jgi:hypothetical protein